MDLLRISYLTHWQAVLVCLLLGCSLSLSKQRNYNGDKVLRVKIANHKEWETVESIMKKYTVEDDIWSHPVTLPSFGDIRVSQHEFSPVTSQLTEHGLSFEVFIENVQDFVNAEKVQSNTKSKPFRRKRATMSNRIIGTYASFDDIVDYIYNAEKNFEIASVTKIGESTEGRPLLVLKLGVPHPDPKVVKPVIWIDAGIHAREWIAPASIMYIIYQLLNGYHEKDPVIFDLIKRIDWMFLPVVNPDGYIYSHSDERLWRKNRVKINGTDCIGVDLNRNFAFHWGEETASADPCHVMFRGVAAGSENETQHVQNFLMANRENIYVYISLHSYSQYWFSRWAYTPERVDTHDEMYGLALRATKALVGVHGTDFKAGRPFELLYGYSGGSADWAYGTAGIPYSYTIELRDKGQKGFLLPVEDIIPQGQELYAGILVVADHIKNISKVDFSFLDTYQVQAITPDDVNHFHFKEGFREDTTPDPTSENSIGHQSIQDGYGIARQGQTTAVLITDLFNTMEMTSKTYDMKNKNSANPSIPTDTSSFSSLPTLPATFQPVTFDSYDNSYDTTSSGYEEVTTQDFTPPHGVLRGSSACAQPVALVYLSLTLIAITCSFITS